VTDSREHPRTTFEAQIAFQLGDGPRIGATCRNISIGGMLVETDQPAPYGTTIRVFMQLPGLKSETVIDAVVRWSKPDGMGVQFGRMGALETHALTQMIGPVSSAPRSQRAPNTRSQRMPAVNLDGFPSTPSSGQRVPSSHNWPAPSSGQRIPSSPNLPTPQRMGSSPNLPNSQRIPSSPNLPNSQRMPSSHDLPSTQRTPITPSVTDDKDVAGKKG